MKIDRTVNGNEVTLHLGGCLDTAATAEFTQALEEATRSSTVVLDMGELEFIASSALRQLVAARKRSGQTCRIVLTGLNDVVREVFDVTGLDTVFEVR